MDIEMHACRRACTWGKRGQAAMQGPAGTAMRACMHACMHGSRSTMLITQILLHHREELLAAGAATFGRRRSAVVVAALRAAFTQVLAVAP